MSALTLAKKHRAHAAEMQLALELGCTPAEARAEIDRREAEERWLRTRAKFEADERREAAMRAATQHLRDLPDESWMMRDR